MACVGWLKNVSTEVLDVLAAHALNGRMAQVPEVLERGPISLTHFQQEDKSLLHLLLPLCQMAALQVKTSTPNQPSASPQRGRVPAAVV